MKADQRIILHGCNAQGVMGSGVAKLIREKFPKAYIEYRNRFESPHGLNLGEVIWSNCGDHIIGNCITQEYYGGDLGVVYADYDAVQSCMIQAKLYANRLGEREVALPKIGAGLAGGDWNVIADIINRSMLDHTIDQNGREVMPVVYVLNENEIPQS